jgi:competence protein ComEA
LAAALGLGIFILVAYRAVGTGSVPVATPTLVSLEQGRIFVHVDGAVSRPGVYELRPGSRVVDAVDAAGGMTAEADRMEVNLAEKLEDGVKVIVPRQGPSSATPSGFPSQTPAGPGEPEEPGGDDLPLPLEDPPAPLAPETPQEPPVEPPASPDPVMPSPGPVNTVAPPPVETPRPAPSVPTASKISLNRGSFEQFASIPGMDETLAGAIITYRKTPHAFTSIDELARVPGFSPGKLDEVRPYLRL